MRISIYRFEQWTYFLACSHFAMHATWEASVLTLVAAPPDNQNQSVGLKELGIPPFLTKSLMIFKSMFGS